MPLQDDDIWDDDSSMTDTQYDRDLAAREWNKLQDVHGMAGYREGMTDGKEQALQSGFDSGFSEGAIVGMEIGRLRGLLSTLIQLYTQTTLRPPHNPTPEQRNRVRELHDELTTLKVDRLFSLEYFKASTKKPEGAGFLTAPELLSLSEKQKKEGGCCGGSGTCGKEGEEQETGEGCCGGSGECRKGESGCGGAEKKEELESVEVGDAEHHVKKVVEGYQIEVYSLMKEVGFDL
ncbi:hypothetical protein HK097_001652 [Rhizophlyctis rosea]|uniref:Protein YAE1 n=1 Tax=Rhizophlyctis rosea TaxID=64517 RepID=A0AAD5SC53_9FUNG|nr:hypothetical protein HK097_001652 [Rhizophlyctis rosea]